MSDIRHGTTTGYRQGCRLPCCATAARKAEQRRRAHRRAKEIDRPEHALTGGAWVRKGLTMHWVASPKPIVHDGFYLFPEEERRDAHRRYWHGDREPSTVAAEREYQRDAKRRAREAREAVESDAA